jgi:hypothetical protein
VHTLVRTLDTNPELRDTVMETISNLINQFGTQFKVFVPMIHRVVKKHGIKHARYENLILFKSKEEEDPTAKAKKANRNMGLTAADTTSISRVCVSTFKCSIFIVICVNLMSFLFSVSCVDGKSSKGMDSSSACV